MTVRFLLLPLFMMLISCGEEPKTSSPSELTAPLRQRATFRGDKIPYAPSFPKAGYPLAQKMDGCSSHDANHPEYVRDNWSLADFTQACNAHDACYYTINSGVQNCNRNFNKDLQQACTDKAASSAIHRATLASCRSLAKVYHAVVVKYEDETYKAAQELQREYNAYANKILTQVFFDYTGKVLDGQNRRKMSAILQRTTLRKVEEDLFQRLGSEVVRRVFKEETSVTTTPAIYNSLMPFLKAGGIYALKSEIYIGHAEEVVKKVYREVHASGEMQFFFLMYYKRLLIETRDVNELRRQIKANG